MAGEAWRTGTRDEHYDLISALHHLLEGAWHCEQYLRDAEQAGDSELLTFFRDWQEEQRHLAERAKNLLASRLFQAQARPRPHEEQELKSGGEGLDDLVDEQSKESFPASDAPGTY